jgi:hypothetical protein
MGDTNRSQARLHDVEPETFQEFFFLSLVRLSRGLRRVQNVHRKVLGIHVAKYGSASFSHRDVLIVISLAYMLLI